VLLNKVVIGHSPESAAFAYLNDCYHIQSTDFQPLFFEEYPRFAFFGTKNKSQIWRKFKLWLGLLARNLDYPSLGRIRIQDNKIKLFDDNLLAEFEFEKCYIFESLNVTHENKIQETKPQIYKVVDDFIISRIGKEVTHISPVHTRDTLLRESYFYNSLRVDGAKFVTDAVTISYLTREQLYDFDYSDTMANFKLKSQLNSLGYIGRKEKGKYKNGTDIYKKLITRHIKRYVLEQDRNTYLDTQSVKFLTASMREMFDASST
jgi:hypothetical protein